MIHGLAVGDPTTFGERLSDEVEFAWSSWAEEIARTEFGVSTAGRQGT